MDNQPQPPYETPYIPYVPPPTPKKERTGLKRAGLVLLIFITLSAVGVSAYAMVRNTSLKDDLASEKSNSQALRDENGKLKGNSSGDSTATITETLPNGKTMKYSDTEANRNILWWNASPDSEDNKDMITLSHKGYQKFLSTLDSDLVAAMCNGDSEPTAASYNISAGTLDTATKTLSESDDTNCVAQLASTDNTDDDSRAAAQKVMDTVNAAVTQFVESVIIE